MKKIFFILILSLLLAGCNIPANDRTVDVGACSGYVIVRGISEGNVDVECVESTPTYEPTNTETMTMTPEPTNTQTFTPSPSSTNTNTPTQTLNPTSTITPSPTPMENSFYYVSPNGVPSGNGSIDNPWDLQTALNHPLSVHSGDTIWLRGGKYGSGGLTLFVSRLIGTDKPITVRSYPEELATIDGGISVEGSYSIFWGLEITNSNTKRSTTLPGSHPSDILRYPGFNILGDHNYIINNIIHDTSEGIGTWESAFGNVIYGNIIYNNGWTGPDRGHGNSMYIQNNRSGDDKKIISNNIVFNNYSDINIQAYSKATNVEGLDFIENVSLNGLFHIGSFNPMRDILIDGNMSYNSKMRLHYESNLNYNIVVSNNFLYSGEQTFEIKYWQDATVIDNFMVADVWQTVNYVAPAIMGTYQWDRNVYYAPTIRPDGLYINMVSKKFSDWKNITGFDANSTYNVGLPAGKNIFIKPNEYDNKINNIIIYNWDSSENVLVDLSDVLEIGTEYTLYNAQNYFGNNISGVYDGQSISIPMTGWSVAIPVGRTSPLKGTTFPRFGIFVLVSK